MKKNDSIEGILPYKSTKSLRFRNKTVEARPIPLASGQIGLDMTHESLDERLEKNKQFM